MAGRTYSDGPREDHYSPGKGEEICELLIEGYSLNKICKMPGMPNRTTVYRWLDRHEKFRERYHLAKELGIDGLVDEILEISDDDKDDLVQNDDGTFTANGVRVQRATLRVNSRKWYASKLAPKLYGDSTQVRHANSEGGELPGPVDPVEAVRRILFAINLGKKKEEDSADAS